MIIVLSMLIIEVMVMMLHMLLPLVIITCGEMPLFEVFMLLILVTMVMLLYSVQCTCCCCCCCWSSSPVGGDAPV